MTTHNLLRRAEIVSGACLLTLVSVVAVEGHSLVLFRACLYGASDAAVLRNIDALAHRRVVIARFPPQHLIHLQLWHFNLVRRPNVTILFNGAF